VYFETAAFDFIFFSPIYLFCIQESTFLLLVAIQRGRIHFLPFQTLPSTDLTTVSSNSCSVSWPVNVVTAALFLCV